MPFNAHYAGQLRIEPPLNETEQKALSAFLGSRRVKTVAGPLDARESLSMGHPDVIDWNSPPQDQPGLYTGLRIANGGEVLEWDGNEKPGYLTDWVRYVINYLLRPYAVFHEMAQQVDEGNPLRSFTFDHVVNGKLVGTARDGTWAIYVIDNAVEQVEATFDGGTEDDA